VVALDTPETASLADREVLELALRDGRIVVTHDHDFASILATSGAVGPSVLVARSLPMAVNELARVIDEALQSAGWLLEQGAVVCVSRRGLRARRLPLQA
jgi:predicted nuclease of predicted toxin-antitoxin system